jgi:cytosine/uracil/thiamine/allantoin permease
MVIWFVLGDLLENATTALNNSLLIMLVLLAPWTAINLVDFFLVRRGHYAITDLFNPKGIYGSWSRRGVIAYLIGVIVEIPFLVLGGEGAYVGWVAENLLSFVDISWLVGMIVSGTLYFVTSRSLDHAAEAVAIQASEAVLSESGTVR